MKQNIIFACFLLASCQTPQVPKQQIEKATAINLSESQIAILHAGLKSVLKDPDSATFSNHSANQSNNGLVTVCGSVNAKNSFGGFTGKKPYIAFLSNGSKYETAKISSDQNSVYAVLKTCNDKGL